MRLSPGQVQLSGQFLGFLRPPGGRFCLVALAAAAEDALGEAASGKACECVEAWERSGGRLRDALGWVQVVLAAGSRSWMSSNWLMTTSPWGKRATIWSSPPMAATKRLSVLTYMSD